MRGAWLGSEDEESDPGPSLEELLGSLEALEARVGLGSSLVEASLRLVEVVG